MQRQESKGVYNCETRTQDAASTDVDSQVSATANDPSAPVAVGMNSIVTMPQPIRERERFAWRVGPYNFEVETVPLTHTSILFAWHTMTF